MTSLLSADNIPILKRFTCVVIGIAGVIGFLFVFLSMYTAVLERTREIGILKALGASPGYILGMLFRETILLAIGGAIAGILMTYGTRALMNTFFASMHHGDRQELVAMGGINRAGRIADRRAVSGPQGRAAGRDRGAIL